MSKKVDYRVRPVTRFVITRFEREDHPNGMCSGGSECRGEFDNYDTAHAVAYALCKLEHDQSGEPPGSSTFTYPGPLVVEDAPRVDAGVVPGQRGTRVLCAATGRDLGPAD